MTAESGEAIGRFLPRLLGLKKVPRRGWVVKLGIGRPESVAEHSFGVALLAALLARSQGLDAHRAALLGLVHDLHECVTGDRMPGEPRSGEESALKGLLAVLPEDLRVMLEGAWREYREGASPEARVVGEADKLEMAAQALLYEAEGFAPQLLDEFWHSAREALLSQPGLAAYGALEGLRGRGKMGAGSM